MSKRESEIKVANKLQAILGEGYEVRYDEHDSCLTRCYFKGQLYKTVANGDMAPSLNVYDFIAPAELRIHGTGF